MDHNLPVSKMPPYGLPEGQHRLTGQKLADVEAKINVLEPVVKGWTVKQHDRIKEARDLIDDLKTQRRALKDRIDQHRRNCDEETRDEEREEKKQELADRKRKREKELDRWTGLISAAASSKQNAKKKIRKLVAQLFNEQDAQLRELSELL